MPRSPVGGWCRAPSVQAGRWRRSWRSAPGIEAGSHQALRAAPARAASQPPQTRSHPHPTLTRGVLCWNAARTGTRTVPSSTLQPARGLGLPWRGGGVTDAPAHARRPRTTPHHVPDVGKMVRRPARRTRTPAAAPRRRASTSTSTDTADARRQRSRRAARRLISTRPGQPAPTPAAPPELTAARAELQPARTTPDTGHHARRRSPATPRRHAGARPAPTDHPGARTHYAGSTGREPTSHDPPRSIPARK